LLRTKEVRRFNRFEMIVVMTPTATKKEIKQVVKSIGAPAHDVKVTKLDNKIIVVANT